jgi:hypothetical protein
MIDVEMWHLHARLRLSKMELNHAILMRNPQYGCVQQGGVLASELCFVLEMK